MNERSNEMHPWVHSALKWAAAWAAKWAARYNRAALHHGRTVKEQMIRGASYGVGSGAVSLLVLWYEHRH